MLLHFLGSIDSLFRAPRTSERKDPSIDSLGQDLPSHAIVDRGRLVGLWEYDQSTESIAWVSFVKKDKALQEAVTRTENFVRDQLGDARSFSLDSPEKPCAPHRGAAKSRSKRLTTSIKPFTIKSVGVGLSQRAQASERFTTMTHREQDVLHSIVESYIQTGEPVASRTIAKQRRRESEPGYHSQRDGRSLRGRLSVAAPHFGRTRPHRKGISQLRAVARARARACHRVTARAGGIEPAHHDGSPRGTLVPHADRDDPQRRHHGGHPGFQPDAAPDRIDRAWPISGC